MTKHDDIHERDVTAKYWVGSPDHIDDFGVEIKNEFIDGATRTGPWAIMTPYSWRQHGVGRLGTGLGQKYQRQRDGRWLKVGG